MKKGTRNKQLYNKLPRHEKAGQIGAMGYATGALGMLSNVYGNLNQPYNYQPQFKQATAGGIGYQEEQQINPSSVNTTSAGLSGAVSGAAAGASLGPIGMGIGAVVGGISSWLGADKKKAAMKAENEKIKQRNQFNMAGARTKGLQNDWNMNGIENNMQYLANGGQMFQPNARVDEGEVIQEPNGNMETVEENNPNFKEVQPNTTDGYIANLQEGTRILSNKIRIPGTKTTFAEAGQKIESKLSKLQKTTPKSRIEANTVRLNESNLQKQYNDLFAQQEAVKGLKTSPTGYYAKGGQVQQVGDGYQSVQFDKLPGYAEGVQTGLPKRNPFSEFMTNRNNEYTKRVLEIQNEIKKLNPNNKSDFSLQLTNMQAYDKIQDLKWELDRYSKWLSESDAEKRSQESQWQKSNSKEGLNPMENPNLLNEMPQFEEYNNTLQEIPSKGIKPLYVNKPTLKDPGKLPHINDIKQPVSTDMRIRGVAQPQPKQKLETTLVNSRQPVSESYVPQTSSTDVYTGKKTQILTPEEINGQSSIYKGIESKPMMSSNSISSEYAINNPDLYFAKDHSFLPKQKEIGYSEIGMKLNAPNDGLSGVRDILRKGDAKALQQTYEATRNNNISQSASEEGPIDVKKLIGKFTPGTFSDEGPDGKPTITDAQQRTPEWYNNRKKKDPLLSSSTSSDIEDENVSNSNMWSDIIGIAPSLMNIANSFDNTYKAQNITPESMVADNPYESQVLGALKKRRARVQPLLDQNNINSTIARYNSRMQGTSGRAYDVATTAGKMRADQQAIESTNTTNNQYLTDYANTLNQFGQQKASQLAAAKQYVNTYNANQLQQQYQSEEAKRNMLTSGIKGVSDYYQYKKSDAKKEMMDLRALALQELYLKSKDKDGSNALKMFMDIIQGNTNKKPKIG